MGDTGKPTGRWGEARDRLNQTKGNIESGLNDQTE